MPLSSAVREQVRPFLPAGEEIRYLFPAMGFGGKGEFIVAVTASQVTVLACAWLHRYQPKSVWARHPRTTRLGPVETSLGPTITLGRLTLEFDEEYLAVVSAADAELAETDSLPPNPLPDL